MKQTINYWALRLTPILKDKEKGKCYFVCANRTGIELGD